jgi:hypothetical protein
MNLHRVALFLVLGIGAAALAYNAVSILHGDTGLTALAPWMVQYAGGRHLGAAHAGGMPRQRPIYR